MRVIVEPDESAVARRVAGFLVDVVSRRGTRSLGLDVMGASLPAYAELMDQLSQRELDTSQLHVFGIGEYVGLVPDDPHSVRHVLDEAILRHLRLDPEQTHVPDGRALDFESHCQHYESLIRAVDGIDLQLTDMGYDGQIGFNEPGSSLGSRTRLKTLTQDMRHHQAILFDNSEQAVPQLVIAMGVRTILESKRCLLMACGAQKAMALRAAIEGPLTSQVTASALQLHRDAIAVVDSAAAGLLQSSDYYAEVERSMAAVAKAAT